MVTNYIFYDYFYLSVQVLVNHRNVLQNMYQVSYNSMQYFLNIIRIFLNEDDLSFYHISILYFKLLQILQVIANTYILLFRSILIVYLL